MIFGIPNCDKSFEISDEWWNFCDMKSFKREGDYYPYSLDCYDDIKVVKIGIIRPPKRNPGVLQFKKYKMVPVLLSFTSPECALPPVPVKSISGSSPYSFELENGFHRYYASIAVGYLWLPVVVRQ